MDANNTTEQTAIQTAIKYFTDRAPMNCGVMYKEFMQVAAWLGKLAAYQDKSYITAEFLTHNGFEPLKAGGYLLDAEVAEIEATLKDCEVRNQYGNYVTSEVVHNGDDIEKTIEKFK